MRSFHWTAAVCSAFVVCAGPVFAAESTSGLQVSLPAVIVDSDPPAGAVDARQPSNLDGSGVTGWDTITLNFNRPVTGLQPTSFTISQLTTGVGGPAMSVSSVEMLAPTSARLHLSAPIQPGGWTTIRYGRSSIRLGYLPGDVDGDGRVGNVDLLRLVDVLNGHLVLPLHATDIDRSGTVNAADLDRLRAVMLGTGGALATWIGQQLPGAIMLPSAPGPGAASQIEIQTLANYENGECANPGDTVVIDVVVRRLLPGEDIYVRGLQFDTRLTNPELAFEFPLTHTPAVGNIHFWDFASQLICAMIPSQCGGQHFIIDDLDLDPFLSITYTQTNQSDDFQIIIPGDGSPRHIGQLELELPLALSPPYHLDLVNAVETAPNEGTYLVFGFGFVGDPITTWRADTGEIVGGSMEICTVAQDCSQAADPDAFCDNGDVCDGVEVCNLDTGECVQGDVPPCGDDVFCNGEEFCDPIVGCVMPGDPCEGTPTPICNEAAGMCVECLTDADCPTGGSCIAGDCITEGGAKITLAPDATCYGWGDVVNLAIDLENAPAPIVGGEFFIAYDPAALDFVASDPGEPWEVEIFNNVDEVAGTIDYAVHVVFNPPGAGATNGTMANLTFIARQDFCGESPIVFRDHNPPTRLTVLGGDEVAPELNEAEVELFDPDADLDCPEDTVLSGPAGPVCQAEACFDDIGGGPGGGCPMGTGGGLTCVASHPTAGEFPLDENGCALFPAGVSTVTCTAAGSCEAACSWTVTVGCDDPGNKVRLQPDQTCYGWGDVVTVDVLLVNSDEPIVGGQFFIAYDNTALDYFASDPGEPWEVEIFNDVNESAGTVDYAVHVPFNPPAAGATSGVMATITFIAVQDFCGETQITWRDHNPPSRVTNGEGQDVPSQFNIATLTLVDPLGSFDCPDDLVTPADAGTCAATVCWNSVFSGGACSDIGDGMCAAVHDGGADVTLDGNCGTFPIGVTTITCGGADCGAGGCSWTITVTEDNVITTEIELSPIIVPGPVARCMTFEVFPEACGDPLVIRQDMVFGIPNNIPMHTTGEFLVPCGAYGCVTARDELHTLRSRLDFMDIIEQPVNQGGYQFVRLVYFALFKGNPAIGGNWLWSGNLNDDCVIDILDFGVFIQQYTTDFGTGDTDCETDAPHADINGDGVVDAADYWFISNNFLVVQKGNCCDAVGDGCSPEGGFGRGKAGLVVDGKGRVLSTPISAGMFRADLNGDGLIDLNDMSLFEEGARPGPVQVRPRDFGRRPQPSLQ